MSESSKSGQSSVEKPALFAFTHPPLSSLDPATIINPERRGLAPTQSLPPITAGSSVWSQLFPQALQSTEVVADGHIEGVTLDHFIIQDRIGSGGMAAVFRARDSRLDRIVALKVLGPNQTLDAASVQRFHNEARAAARLDHDNVARVYYDGEDRGVHFIAYEYVSGRTVRDLIHAAGHLEATDAVNITLQIAAALKHTSASGVVHRDIKPSNIIVSAAGRAKIVDLGLARNQDNDSAPDLTIAGTTLGTFDYISPEQAKDPRKVDVRSDIYSLGCTLYHMLTGSPPYPEGTVLQKLLDHQDAKLPDPRDKNPRVSPQLSTIVQKMMASNPDERYQRPDDLIADLMVIAAAIGLRSMNPDGLVWAVPRVERPGFWQKNVAWIATAGALLAIVLLLEYFPQRSSEPNDRSSTASQGPSAKSSQSSANDTKPPTVIETADTNDPAIPRNPRTVFDESADSTSFPPAVTNTIGSSDDKASKSARPPEIDASTETNTVPAPMPDLPVGIATTFPDTDGPVAAPKPSRAPTDGRVATVGPSASDPFAVPSATVLPPISLTFESGRTESYPTLEAACRAAQDGSVIVLNYDGQRVAPPERRLKIENKRITVRAGRRDDGSSFRPLVVFEGLPRSTDADSRLITLVGGGMKLINLDIQISLRNKSEANTWALFSFIGANRVRLQGTRVTMVNPVNRPATVFELNPALRIDDMKTMPGSPPMSRMDLEVEVVDSIVRGGCDLFTIKQATPGRFSIENSLVAIGGTLITTLGNHDVARESEDLELQVNHATCVVGKGFIKMDSGDEGRELLPLSVTASNSVFAATTPASTLVQMTGNTTIQDFVKRLRWEGERNVFDRFDMMWSIRPTSVTAGFEEYRFDDWLRFWSLETEVNVSENDSFWNEPGWRNKDLAAVSARDFLLDEEHENVTIAQGTDGETIGADVSRLDRLLAAPQHFGDFDSDPANGD